MLSVESNQMDLYFPEMVELDVKLLVVENSVMIRDLWFEPESGCRSPSC